MESERPMNSISAENRKTLMLFSGRAFPGLAEEIGAVLGMAPTPTDIFEFGTSVNRLDKLGMAVEMDDACLGGFVQGGAKQTQRGGRFVLLAGAREAKHLGEQRRDLLDVRIAHSFDDLLHKTWNCVPITDVAGKRQHVGSGGLLK